MAPRRRFQFLPRSVVMARCVLSALLGLAVSGCALGPTAVDSGWQTTHVLYDNPVLLPVADHEYVWETVVDVIDDYFKIEREEPVRVAENVVPGWLETFPEVGSTLFEPWRRDSVGPYEKLQSTLQSTRRWAKVRVDPAPGGFRVDVAVFKELEDVVQPAQATAGAATFRHDSSLTRVVNPVGEHEITEGWIPMGRDTALEQRIIEQLLARSGAVGWQAAVP
jgi:hypothetical protein